MSGPRRALALALAPDVILTMSGVVVQEASPPDTGLPASPPPEPLTEPLHRRVEAYGVHHRQSRYGFEYWNRLHN